MAVKAIIPDYLTKFKCIASQCEDTCCIGWNVNIDKKTYKKYRETSDKDFKKKFNEHFKRNTKSPSELSYAHIVMDRQGKCPFLNDQLLCNIHKTKGEDYLSNICRDYPRNYNLINCVIEKNATLSCPEVARLSLLNKDGISFHEVEESDKNYIYNVIINKNLMKNKYKIGDNFETIRVFTIQILKTRDYSIEERLIILGLFYKNLSELMRENNIGEIQNIITRYTHNITSGVFKEQLGSLIPKDMVQIDLLKGIVDQGISKGLGVNSSRYLECYMKFLIGIDYNSDKSKEEIVGNYKAAFKNYFIPFLNDHEYILENYLVHYAFNKLMPLGKSEDVFQNYMIFVLHYAIIRMHLIGLSGLYKDELKEEVVIKLIQSFTKSFGHNEVFWDNTAKFINQNNYASIAYVAILIKN